MQLRQQKWRKILFLHDIIESFVAHDHGIQNRVFLKSKVILLKNGHSYGVGDINVALCRLKLTAKKLQKRGLTRTVSTYNAVAVTGCKLEVNVLKKKLTAKLK